MITRKTSEKLMRIYLYSLVVAAFLIVGTCGQGVFASTMVDGPDDAAMAKKYIPGELLVKFKHNVSKDKKEKKHNKHKAKKIKEFKSIKVQHIRLDPDMTVEEAIAIYSNDPDVEYAEPNFQGSAHENIPDDPQFDGQWDLYSAVYQGHVDAPLAWDITTGSGDVVVAVIDSGIDYNHEDLAANMWTNPGETAGDANVDGCPGLCDTDDDGDGLIDEDSAGNSRYLTDGITTNPDWLNDLADDDDENGYADDIHGINTTSSTSNDPIDTSGHGTNVAGTIGAVGNNTIGISGMNWDVKILACKSNYSTSNLLSCLEYLKTMKDQFGVNIVASNNSYEIYPSQAINDTINEQMTSDILFVASAGNKGLSRDKHISLTSNPPIAYPAGNSNVISVAMTANSGEKSSGSDYGRYSIDVGAPGNSVPTTRIGNLYTTAYGTSIAASQVTGLAGLIKSAESEIAGTCSNSIYVTKSDCIVNSGVWTITPDRCTDPAMISEIDCKATGAVWVPAGKLSWIDIKNRIMAGGEFKTSLDQTSVTGNMINAYGSLTCTDSNLLTLKHKQQRGIIGEPFILYALSFDCLSPVDVTATTGNNEVIDLKDDGVSPDEVAGDGVFTGTWVPQHAQESLTLVNYYGSATENFNFRPKNSLDTPSQNQYADITFSPPSIDADGNLIMPVYRYSDGTSDISKYDPDGNFLETLVTLPTSGKITLDDNGNMFLVYREGSYGTPYNLVVSKYDNAGNELNSAVYTNGGNLINSTLITTDNSGNVFVVGSSWGPLPHQLDWHIIKYDANLNLLWNHVYTPQGKYPGDYCSVDGGGTDSLGNLYLTGTIYYGYSGGHSGFNYNDITLKFDKDTGDIVWDTRFTSLNTDLNWSRGMAIDSNDNIYVIGEGTSPIGGYGRDVFIVKYDTTGAVIWSNYVDLGLYVNNTGINVDGNGLVYAFSAGEIMVNYDPSQGEVWHHVKDEMGSDDRRSITINDDTGYVYLVGGYAYGQERHGTIKKWSHFYIATLNLPGAPVDIPYSATLSASNASALPLTWEVIDGVLPPGLTLDGATGEIFGTPTLTGIYDIEVQVTDVNLISTTRKIQVDVQESLDITTPSVPHGLVLTPYSHTLSASGGSGSYTWSLVSGALPVGLVIDASTGEIYGTTTLDGSYSFTVEIADSNVPVATPVQRSYSIDIYQQVQITAMALPAATAGFPYIGATMAATGGTGNYTWSWSGATIPGLTLDSVTGVISGTPSYIVDNPGFTVHAQDGGSTASVLLSIDLSQDLVLTIPSSPLGATGIAYNLNNTISGGKGTLACTVSSGILPPGLSLDSLTCDVSGTSANAGIFDFTLRLTDQNYAWVEESISIEIVENDQVMNWVSAVVNGYQMTIDYSVSHPQVSYVQVRFYLSEDTVIQTSDQYLGYRSFSASEDTPYIGQQTITLSTNIPSGTYYVGAIVDSYNSYEETDEMNNTAYGEQFVHTALPDLYTVVMYNANFITSQVVGGQSTIEFAIRNNAVTPAGASTVNTYLSTDYTYSGDDILLASSNVPTLGGNDNYSVTQQITIPSVTPGSYYLLIVADSNNQVEEARETNNRYARSLLLTADYPDLVVTSLGLSSYHFDPGTYVTVDVEVLNQGPDSAGSSTVQLYMSDDPLITNQDIKIYASSSFSSVPQLASGETYVSSRSVRMPSSNITGGTYYIGAIADDREGVAESDEGNNVSLAAEVVVDVRDIVVTAVSGTVSGDQLTIDLTVKNIGSVMLGASATGIYLSDDDWINTYYDILAGSVNVPALDPGEQASFTGLTFTLPVDLAVGYYYLGAYADIDKQISETTGQQANNLTGPLVDFITVLTPRNVLPSDAVVVNTLTPELISSAYSDPVRDGAHAVSQWQVSERSDIDGLKAKMSEDDDYVFFTMPFTFPFFGRDITAICSSTNGSIELLEVGETECQNSGVWHSEGDHVWLDSDLIFVSQHDLDARPGYMEIYDRGSHVLIEWYVTTYSDGDIVNYPMLFQAELHQDGTVNWNFTQMDYLEHDYFDMYSGIYAQNESLEIDVGYEITRQSSYTFDPVSQTVNEIPYNWNTPSFVFYDSGESVTDLETHTVPVSAGLAFDSVYYWRVRYMSDNNDWSHWSPVTSFSVVEPYLDMTSIVTDRPVYLPGETIGVTASVTNISGGDLQDVVVDFTYRYPDGNTLYSGTKTVNRITDGSTKQIISNFQAPVGAPEGLYSVEAAIIMGGQDYDSLATVFSLDPNSPPLEVCDDTIDNDGDGFVDCDDSDCDAFCQALACEAYKKESSCVSASCSWNSNKGTCGI